MKKILFLLPLFTSCLINAQIEDSIIIRQVDSLISVSREFVKNQDFKMALEVNAIGQKLTLDKIKNESVIYGRVCENYSYIFCIMGNFDDALIWSERVLEIRKKSLGNDHREYIATLTTLASIYKEIDKYYKAEPLFLEAKTKWEKLYNVECRDYLMCIHNLAMLYTDMGIYSEAEILYVKSLNIIEKLYGKESEDFTMCLNNLANMYSVLGNFNKAEKCFIQVIDIQDKLFGKNHPDYARSINNLANLYQDLGNYEKAEKLHFNAKEIREKILDSEHYEFGSSLVNLGNLYRETGRFKLAESFLLDALNIWGKAFGYESIEYAMCLENLAILNNSFGNYNESARLYHEAYTIWEVVEGKDHFDCAINLKNQGILYTEMSDYEKAEKVFLESIAIIEKVYGKKHPEYANCMNELGKLYGLMGNYGICQKYYSELSKLNHSFMVNAIYHLSEKEIGNYLKTFLASQNRLFTFTRLAGKGYPEMHNACFDDLLFLKGFIFSATTKIRHLALTNSKLAPTLESLKMHESLIAREYSKPLNNEDSEGLRVLEDSLNIIQKRLAGELEEFQELKKLVSWLDIQAKLKEHEVALEFTHYINFDKSGEDSIYYAAMVVKKRSDHPVFIHLFKESEILKLFNNRKNKVNDKLSTQLYASRGATPIGAESLQGLYDLIWKPLDSVLQNMSTVYYSPSGLLNRINFDAIPVDEISNLSDKFKLVQLGSTRSLVVPDLTKVDSSNKVILFGGIHYNIDTTVNNLDTVRINLLASSIEELSFSYADRGVKESGSEWSYLPGTEKEIDGVSKLIKKSIFYATEFSGEKATEEAFKNFGKSELSPRVLHIATHGFFFPDAKSSIKNEGSRIKTEPVFKISDHPMIRSGLILAGGNYAWKEGKPFKEGMEDGILTAYEISQMNLSNTELVVLSACETGLGDIQGNEGVYGLQRAFKIAGAKYLMMSLWQVPDEETKEFMISFYKNWLNKKLNIPDAFRITQKEMREKYTDPYLWAGFVLVE